MILLQTLASLALCAAPLLPGAVGKPASITSPPLAVTPALQTLGWAYVPKPAALAKRVKQSNFRALAKHPLSRRAAASTEPWYLTIQRDNEGVMAKFQPELPAPDNPLRQVFGQAAARGDDVRAYYDVQRMLALLPALAGRRSAMPQGLSSRLGLAEFTDANLSGRLRDARSMAVQVEVSSDRQAEPPPGSLLAALGPDVPTRWPQGVPNRASFVAASVVPARAWLSLETTLAALYPLQYGLFRVQLDALEQQTKQRWVDDVLGTTPQKWWIYGSRSAENDFVAVLPVQNAASAADFLRLMAAAVASLSADVELTAGKVKQVQTLTFAITTQDGAARSAVLAFLPHAVVCASTLPMLQAYLSSPLKERVHKSAPVASAALFADADAKLLQRPLRWFFGGAAAEIPARVVLSVQPQPAAWQLKATVVAD